METIIGKEFPEKVIPLIKEAKNSIDIVVYNWYWYPDQIGSEIQRFNNAIIDARKKGKKVRVITNSKKIVGILRENKIEAKEFISSKTLHAKLILIDDQTAISGSHNYTMSAFTTNFEVSVITQERDVVKRLKLFFDILWS